MREGREERSEGTGPSLPTASTLLPPSSGLHYRLVLSESKVAGAASPQWEIMPSDSGRALCTAQGPPHLWPTGVPFGI